MKYFFEDPASRIKFVTQQNPHNPNEMLAIWRADSLAHERLIKERRRWYPAWNNYEKIVPTDLVLDKDVLLHWFMDDGYSTTKARQAGGKSVFLAFCTHGFGEDYVDFLRQMMLKTGFTTYIFKEKRQGQEKEYPVLKLAYHQVNDFLDFIGPCPIESLSYKWKRPDPYLTNHIGQTWLPGEGSRWKENQENSSQTPFDLTPQELAELRPIWYDVHMEPKEKPGSDYPELNNKIWLEEHYHSLQLNMREIGDIVGCDEETVRQAMLRFNIPIRSKTQAFKINSDDGFSIATSDALSFFEGLMLGQGSLICNPGSILPAFSKSSQHRDLLEYFKQQLFKPDSHNRIFENDRENDDGTERTSFKLTSLGHECLQKEYVRWYSNRRKIVPQNIILTPKTLLAWFLSGSTAYYGKPRTDGSKSRIIELLTNAFTEKEVLFLQNQLLKKLYIKSLVSEASNHKGSSIKISLRQVGYFLDIIGSTCPIPNNEILAKKWIRPDPCRVKPLGPIYK